MPTASEIVTRVRNCIRDGDEQPLAGAFLNRVLKEEPAEKAPDIESSEGGQGVSLRDP